MTNLFIAALPEPTTGQSTANKKIYEEISKESEIKLINTSPKTTKKNFFYHSNRILSHLIAIKSIILAQKLRNVYTVYESGHGIIYNKIIFFFTRMKGGRIILHHHTSEHTIAESKRFKSLIDKNSKNITHIFLSKSMEHDFFRNYGNASSIVINNSSLIKITTPLLHKNICEKITIGYISNITIEKGIANIYNIIAKLVENNVNFDFILAGPVTDEKSHDVIKKCASIAGEKFKYLGKVYGSSKDDFFESIDLLVFPSEYKYEAQPLVILEAISRGIPVLSSKIGYSWEIVPSNRFFLANTKYFDSFVLKRVEEYMGRNEYYKKDQIECLDLFYKMLEESKLQMSELIKIMK